MQILVTYPLTVMACTYLANNSFLGMHRPNSTAAQAAVTVEAANIPAEAMAVAEAALYAAPALLAQVAAECTCGNPAVEAVLAAYAKHMGLE